MSSTKWRALALALACLGCGSTLKPLDVGGLSRSKAKTLLVVKMTTDAFFVSARLADMPFASAASVGAQVRRKLNLADPVVRLGDHLAREFGERQGLAVTIIDEPLAASANKKGRTAPLPPLPRPPADLVLELRTTEWVLHANVYGESPAVQYAAQLSLVDSRDGRLLAQGTCRGDTAETAKATAGLSYDDFTKDDGARLKRALDEAADRCATEASTTVLSTRP